MGHAGLLTRTALALAAPLLLLGGCHTRNVGANAPVFLSATITVPRGMSGLEDATWITTITDGVAPYTNAEFFARTIPGAMLYTVEGGGHLCVATHRQQTIPVMETFLRCHAPPN